MLNLYAVKLLVFSHKEQPREIWLICPSICLILNSTPLPPAISFGKGHYHCTVWKQELCPKRGQGHTFLQTFSQSQFACCQKQRENSEHGENAGILTMAMWNEWDRVPASHLMMLSIFRVILKLTQAWLLATIPFTSTAYICILLPFLEHGLCHSQPRNEVRKIWQWIHRKGFTTE